jgi:hypothetical protein
MLDIAIKAMTPMSAWHMSSSFSSALKNKVELTLALNLLLSPAP